MAIYNKVQLKNLNANKITTNANEEITGEVLREHLIDLIDSIASVKDANTFEAIQSYNASKTFTSDLHIVDKKYVDDKVAAVSFYEIITYANLLIKVTANELSIGKIYIISDFKTNVLGSIEVILLKASSTNTFYNNIASATYPNDTLEYRFGVGYKGVITKRIDTSNNITFYDSKYYNPFVSCNSIHLGYNTYGFAFPNGSNNTEVSANINGSSIVFGPISIAALTNSTIHKKIYNDAILGIVLEYNNNGDKFIINTTE